MKASRRKRRMDSASSENPREESSVGKAARTKTMKVCSNICTEKKVIERGAYVQLFVNLDTLGESIRYFIDTEGETPVEPFVCTKCYKVFYLKEQEMAEHSANCQATDVQELSYVCQKCYFQVDTMFESCLHDLDGACDGKIEIMRMTECSRTNPRIVYEKYIKRFCRTCVARIFVANKRTIDHLKCQCCNSKLHYVCVRCNELFQKYYQAKYHLSRQCMRIVHACSEPNCSFNTDFISMLQSHMRTCHGEKVSYRCKVCSYKTTKNKRMSKHLVEEHDEKDYYKCDVCPEWATQDESSYRRHTSTHRSRKREEKDTGSRRKVAAKTARRSRTHDEKS